MLASLVYAVAEYILGLIECESRGRTKKKIFYCRLNSFVNVLCSFVALCFVLFLLLPSPLSVSCAECALWQYVQSPLMLYGSSLTLVLIKLNRQKARNIFFHLAQEDVFFFSRGQ
ncbi:hypothetical protein OUZ56_004229 [Daphnia magna]|uniref:Uncharacterized protein n=1 Tax=Daphnia magna TaxID=35525 RepID=A0ABQ9YP41_9CRUS|nr:hypothetical protein OUZ56_004229 [Daphnia magna]